MSHTSRAFAPNQSPDIKFHQGMDKHHLARLAMMMAEERGEVLTYEEAINL